MQLQMNLAICRLSQGKVTRSVSQRVITSRVQPRFCVCFRLCFCCQSCSPTLRRGRFCSCYKSVFFSHLCHSLVVNTVVSTAVFVTCTLYGIQVRSICQPRFFATPRASACSRFAKTVAWLPEGKLTFF